MTDPNNQSQPTEYDSPWKEILKAYFKDFLEFFLAEAHDGINWQRNPEFLDKELDRITKEAKAINRRVDLLVKVWLINDDELWVLIHVEIQGNRDPEFAERMYTCQHRAYDLHRRPVVGLAILADEEPSWRVSEYRQVLWGSEVIYRFNTVKLLDFLGNLSELETSDNPFAIVTFAHLTGKQTKNEPEKRFQEKQRITRRLYRLGFSRQKIIDLYRFIDWVLSLPTELDDLFWEELSKFEENQQMPYITSVERIGIEKGRLIGIQIGEQIGEQKGEAKILTRQLQRRFGSIPDWAKEKIAGAEPPSLEEWSLRFVDAQSLDDVFSDKM
ncbi:MAG: DUF4351 domain-containing protein [Magnetococcales bacterium]|nr:DUF4351 domain-containing protein [Magnetococcales bacterium]